MRAQGGSRETFGKQPGDARQNPYEFIKPSMTMIRNPTNLFGLQRWWSEAWWNHKILKIETSSKKAPYGPIKSNIIKICFTRSPYPFLNLNEIQTTPGPKKNESGTKTGLKNRTHLCPRFVKETINFITKTSPDTRGHFFAGASKKMKTLRAQKWKRDAYDTCWYCRIPYRDDPEPKLLRMQFIVHGDGYFMHP